MKSKRKKLFCQYCKNEIRDPLRRDQKFCSGIGCQENFHRKKSNKEKVHPMYAKKI